MAELNFPASPTLGQTHTENGGVWKWNGTSWVPNNILGVDLGGTGLPTLVSNNVILGNGTSAVQFVAPGTSGNVLTSNGTTWTSAAAGASLTGETNTATTKLGRGAGTADTDNVGGTYVGVDSGALNTGLAITAIGRQALDANTTGSSNTAVGQGALGANTTGERNVAVGSGSLLVNTTSSDSTAIGTVALGSSTGASNTGLGYFAGQQVTTGQQNTLLGARAGASGVNDLTTGSNNIILGFDAAASSATVNNETTIGNSSTTSARIFGDLKFLNSYTERVFAITDGATVNLDPNNGSIQTWTLGASRTPGQANWAAGQSITLMIDDGSAFTISWSTLGVIWETNAGSAPTLATTGFTVIVLWKVGNTIYGARVGDA